MPLQDGLDALNLIMPKRIPRTEYSAERHWKLVQAETGIEISKGSNEEAKAAASQAFYKAWRFDLSWNIMHIHDTDFTVRTKMGHAEYEDGGVDYSNVVDCPFKSPEDVLAFNPMEAYGKKDKEELVQRFNRDYRNRCEMFPDAVNMTGVYVTLVSGLIEMFGWDMMLMAMGTDSGKFAEVTGNYAKWISQYFEALAECNSPVIMVHDDIVWTSGPFTNPEWYRNFVFPRYEEMIQPILKAGKKVLYTSDGDYTCFFDDIVDCGFHGLVMEPTCDMKMFAEKYWQSHVFIGNVDTRILLSGTKDEIYHEVKRCIDIGRDCPGFFMAVGNHIPANTPIENALYYNECYNNLSER